MNETWSKYVQTTEELYTSRELRFHDGNKELWLNAIGVKEGQNILEVGCAGGTFVHRIKQYVPHISITGIDLDTRHIEYAKLKSSEKNLDCTFVNGDALKMPFQDNLFDLCYSHTVCEHVPQKQFFKEQYRVLKPGGMMTVLSVRTRLGVHNDNRFITSEEETELLNKAWSKAGNFDREHQIGAFEMSEQEYPKELEKSGFHDVNVQFFTVVDYAPDNASVSDEVALYQINCHRLHSIASVHKALNHCSSALTETEKETLINLINARYDKRIEQYQNGEKLWDFNTVTVLAVNGRK